MDENAPITPTVSESIDASILTSPSLLYGPQSESFPSLSSGSSAMPAPKLQMPSRPRRSLPAVDLSALIPARRSSTRSIKRKKFDDELVESSLIKTERVGRNVKERQSVGAVSPLSASSSALSPSAHQQISSGAQGQLYGAQTISSVQQHMVVNSGSTFASESSSSPSSNITSSTNVDIGGVSTLNRGIVSSRTPGSDAQQSSVTATVGFAETSAPVKDQATKVESASSCHGKHKDNWGHQQPAKPVMEKRSRHSSGKSAAASKGGGGKGAASKQPSTASKAIGSKVVSSRTSVSKTKSRVSSKSKSKKSSRKQKDLGSAVKDLGRWKPHDDLALITAVQQTNDLSVVYTGVKFSCRFTLKEIEERWYALLYDPAISKIAMEAARQLHQDTVATIQGKALFSNAEEKLLGTVSSTSQPTQDVYQSLLQQHPDVFHPARTAKTLLSHWLLMKQYHLLPDQTVQPMPRGDHILNLSDIEDFMNDDDLGESEDETVEKEMSVVDRRNKREIRHLEQELPKWQVLVDSVTGISMPDFDSQTLGVLRGRLVRYLMRSKEISLGRSTKDNHVDVDLSLEGPAWKVSRRQGIIKLRNSGDFFIANEGKRPIIVDGKPVLCGNKQKLNNNSVVEISSLRFTFLINQDVINAIRTDSNKPGTTGTVVTS